MSALADYAGFCSFCGGREFKTNLRTVKAQVQVSRFVLLTKELHMCLDCCRDAERDGMRVQCTVGEPIP